MKLKELKRKLEKDFGWENLGSDDNKWFVDALLKDTIKAMNVVRSCELVNHDFQIGDDVWITTKKLVVVADFCADGERVQVEDGCEYYLVDKDELTKVI